MTRQRFLIVLGAAAGALVLAGLALAGPAPSDREHGMTIATTDSDTAWVQVQKGPRMRVVVKESGQDEPGAVDIDLSNLGQVIADAMEEVSRSLQNLDVSTVGSGDHQRLIIRADGKETVVDVGAIMKDVNREVSQAMREVHRDLERCRHDAREGGIRISRDHATAGRARLEADRAELQAEMNTLRAEMAKLRAEIEKMRARD